MRKYTLGNIHSDDESGLTIQDVHFGMLGAFHAVVNTFLTTKFQVNFFNFAIKLKDDTERIQKQNFRHFMVWEGIIETPDTLT